jgi:DNA-binding NtrC family response regulator
MAILMGYEWPGNVRELENIIQRAVVLTRGNIITPDHIIFRNELNRFVLDVDQKVRSNTSLDEILREVKRETVLAALRLNDQDSERAARQIGLSEEQLRALQVELKMVPDLEPASQEVLSRLVRKT